MSERHEERRTAEEASGVPEAPGEHREPASPAPTPGGEESRSDSEAEGALAWWKEQ